MSLFLGRAAESLHFAVRPGVVFKYFGLLLLPLAALTIVPCVVTAFAGSVTVAWRYGTIVGAFTVVGLLGRRLPGPMRIQTNEALVVTALIFTIPPVVLAYPVMAYGIGPLDAIFESVSGVTTTGLSALPSVEDRPPAFLFGRAWLQWTGGLGVVVLALALMIEPGASAKQLGFDDREMDDLVGGTRAHARRVLVVYLALTTAGIGAVWILGTSFFDAVVHTLAAVSTGGFSSHDASLAGLPTAGSRAAVTFFCLAGAIPFAWYYSGALRKPLRLLKDVQLRGLLAASLLFVALLQVELVRQGTAPLPALGHAFLTGISAQTTAGFSSLPSSELSAAAKLVLICAMGVGGGIGSTAGGIKVLRCLILLRIVGGLLQRASIPGSGRSPLRLGTIRLRPAEIRGAAAIVAVYLIVVLVSWFLFLVFGYDPLDSLFEVASATATAGLSSGIVGPDLEPSLKLVLCLDMIMGRVEVVAVLMLLFPPTWIGKRRGS